MNIIFLDFFGVLNSERYNHITSQLNIITKGAINRKDKYGRMFDPECVANFEYLAKTTDSKVVLTSNWNDHALEDYKEMLRFRAVNIELIGILSESKVRRNKLTSEIYLWINSNLTKGERDKVNYVSLHHQHLSVTRQDVKSKSVICFSDGFGYDELENSLRIISEPKNLIIR